MNASVAALFVGAAAETVGEQNLTTIGTVLVAIITSLAALLQAARKRAVEVELPQLRRDVADCRADVLALSRHVFALEQRLAAAGQDAPPRPKLRSVRLGDDAAA